MRQIGVLLIVLTMTVTAHLGGVDGLPGPQPLGSDGIVGTWQLVSRLDRSADGQIVPEPELGSDPVALLIYDRAGHVAAQLMRRNRSTTPATLPQRPSAAGALDNSGAVGGYDAYFGRYVVDGARGTVTHMLDAALVQADVGRSLIRHFRLVGNELEMWFSTTAADGRPVTRTLKWKRVA